MKLLEVEDLSVQFFTDEGIIRAVDGLSFSLGESQTLGIVGESGCGKSMTALSILRLIPPPGKIVSGRIAFEGKDLLELPLERMREIRGGRIAMIFQDPMTSLNPVMTAGSQIEEAILLHHRTSKRKAQARALELLETVQIPNVKARYDSYPHELSGGMRQRVMIAMALSCEPAILIADEPTTALDVTVQAQILDLLKDLQRQFKMSIILITHNLGVVAQLCDDVIVMYAGRAVEIADTQRIFRAPKHPYTLGLLTSLPRLDGGMERLIPIEGQLPILKEKPLACTFAPRCNLAAVPCWKEEPALLLAAPEHWSRCFFHDRVKIER